MKNRHFGICVLLPLLAFVLCSGFVCTGQVAARDAIAGAHGWIVNAQATWGPACMVDPTPIQCTSTNKLIAAEHVAADALTAYCGGVPTPPALTYDAGGPCVPVKGLQQSLIAAVTSMNTVVDDVKTLLAKGK